MKKQPEITARTRTRIMNAFWELYKEQRIEKISIGAIMRSASLNRGTFYEYFTDIYDLLEACEERLLGSLSDKAEAYFARHAETALPFLNVTSSLAEILTAYEEDVFILLNKDPGFRSKLKSHLRERMLAEIHIDPSAPYLEYYLAFAIAAITNLIECWHTEGKQISAEELLTLSHQLIFNGFMGALEKFNQEAQPFIHDSSSTLD